jgi:hypothetical protein
MGRIARIQASKPLALVPVLAILTLLLFGGVPPAAAASGTYSEDFLTTTFRDPTVTNVTGWGTGTVTLPHKPLTRLGSYDTPGIASGIWVAGGIAYVADWDSLLVLNVTNPASPALWAPLTAPAPPSTSG